MKSFHPFAQPLDADRSLSPMRAIVERYTADASDITAYFAIPGSKGDLERLVQFNRQWQRRIASIDPTTLELDDRIDLRLMQTHLRSTILQCERDRDRIDCVDAFLPFRPELVALLESHRAQVRVSPREIAEKLDSISRLADEVARNVITQSADQLATEARCHALRAVKLIRRMLPSLADWRSFYEPYDPEFAWWTAQPFEGCISAMSNLQARLELNCLGSKQEEDQTLVGEPIGRIALQEDLECAWIPYTPEELIEIGRSEYEWCLGHMLQASKDLGFDDDWKRALDHACHQHLAPGQQPMLIKTLAREAIQWVQDRDLVTLPPWCAEGWQMRMMSAEQQRVNPYFLGGQTIRISYPTQSMTHAEKHAALRGNNIHFCRATVHHELIPGHHLQLFMAERYNRHRKLFTTPFLVEGWALHWEFLLWDQGFPRTPENKIGMLFWRMHRAARVIFSLRFHLGQISAEEAVQFIIDKVGHEPEIARAEIRRSISDSYPALYQAAYLLGALQMRALFNEFVTHGQMPPKTFHDAVLRQNAIPIELIRAALLADPAGVPRQTAWRFF